MNYSRHDWSQTRTLYLILQGEFVLFQEENDCNPETDTLRIVAPYLCDHQYKGGPWLTDWKSVDELPRVLQLKNVVGDRKNSNHHCCRAIPEKNLDIILNVGSEKPSVQNARLDISAPMPLAILPGLLEPQKDTVITVTDHGKVTHPIVPPVATLIPILVYKWFADSRPYLLDPETDDKLVSAGPSDDFQSLHLFASSPCPETPAHAAQAFTAAAKLLGVNATIEFGHDPAILIPGTPLAGLSWAQVNLLFSSVLCFDPCDPRLKADWLDTSQLPKDCPMCLSLLGGPSGNCGPTTGARS